MQAASTEAREQPTPEADIAEFVDVGSYPINERSSRAYRDVVARCSEQLAQNGCAVLPQFLCADAMAAVTRESEALAPKAHFNNTYTNPYNSDDDPSLPEDHPKRLFQDRSNGFVAGDLIDEDTAIRRLYRAPEVQSFVADCLGVERVYEYADPLAGLVINVLRPGCQHPWHFDTNEFIVTMLTKQPEGGGVFEYCPGIRSPEYENFDGVRDVLKGGRGPVHELTLKPGDLQIFFGRYSLHRVTRVAGAAERHTLILGYSKAPDVIGRAERTKKIFGRLAEVHEQQDSRAPERGDTLSD